MKKLLGAIALFQILLVSCSKSVDNPTLVSETATISVVKYPCGPTCTAEAWVLTTGTSQSYETLNLPDAFRKDSLPVNVLIKKTGQPSTLAANGVAEKVEVVNISLR